MQNLTKYKGRPLRAMQVHSLYAEYIKRLYEKEPMLADKSFAVQMKAFVRDAYSAIHMLMPYLGGCETLLVMANCAQMQGAWLRENGLEWPQDAPWQSEIVRLQVEHFKPDILYFTDPIAFDASFLRQLSQLPPCIMGWRAADVLMEKSWDGYDAILSGLPKLLAFAKTMGAKDGIMFHPGMPTWLAKEVATGPQDLDVIFIGSISPTQHVHRLALVQSLAKAATIHGFSLKLHLNCHDSIITSEMRPYVSPPIFGLDMQRALRRARIVVDDRAWHGAIFADGRKALDLGGEDTSNMRLFEGTGVRTLVLTEHLEGVVRYFELGKEVVTYINHQDAIEKICYYLSHEDERQNIANAGFERCLNHWNMSVASKKFLEIAQSILKKG